MVTSLYSQEPIYNSTYVNLGSKISKFQDPKNPEQFLSSNKFFGVEVNCTSIFATTIKTGIPMTKVGTGDKVLTIYARDNFHIRKKSGWQDMIFKYASIKGLYDIARTKKTFQLK